MGRKQIVVLEPWFSNRTKSTARERGPFFGR